MKKVILYSVLLTVLIFVSTVYCSSKGEDVTTIRISQMPDVHTTWPPEWRGWLFFTLFWKDIRA